MVEEVEDIKSLISGMNKDISEFRLSVARLEKEIEVMKTSSKGKRRKMYESGSVFEEYVCLWGWNVVTLLLRLICLVMFCKSAYVLCNSDLTY